MHRGHRGGSFNKCVLNQKLGLFERSTPSRASSRIAWPLSRV
jgi:hypothetical protein